MMTQEKVIQTIRHLVDGNLRYADAMDKAQCRTRASTWRRWIHSTISRRSPCGHYCRFTITRIRTMP